MNKELRKTIRPLAYASSVGFVLVISSFGGLFLGIYLDQKLGTGHKLAILLFLIGTIAGFRNIFGMLKKYFREERPVIERLKYESHRKRPLAKKA